MRDVLQYNIKILEYPNIWIKDLIVLEKNFKTLIYHPVYEKWVTESVILLVGFL